MTFTPQPEDGEGEQFCFQLANDKLDFLFIAEGSSHAHTAHARLAGTTVACAEWSTQHNTTDEADYRAWVTALEANQGKEPRPPLSKEKAQGRFQRLTRRTTKNLAGKAASSPLGTFTHKHTTRHDTTRHTPHTPHRTHAHHRTRTTRMHNHTRTKWGSGAVWLKLSGKRAIRNKLPKEITELIAALKAIIQMESKSSKKAGACVSVCFARTRGRMAPTHPILRRVCRVVCRVSCVVSCSALITRSDRGQHLQDRCQDVFPRVR
jgi:hypothetical protein